MGDSIFHCHFYPHFAEGMWELWRSHDVFETGTELNDDGIPVEGARALPDGEIKAGTPTPAILPLPTIAMAPMPTDTVPGYPFFNPAVAGHRPPKPPLDTIDDGGLPRHIITGGTFTHVESPLDFSKKLITAKAQEIPEDGTSLKYTRWNIMRYVGIRALRRKETQPISFLMDSRAEGAPFADPCIDPDGNAVGIRALQSGGVSA